ncbi:hypothetical protein DRJ72_14275, partial [Enterococcus faecalis]
MVQNGYLEIRERKKNTQTGDHTFIQEEKMRGRLISSPKTDPVFRTRDYQLIFGLVLVRSTEPMMSTKVGEALSV